MKSRILFLFLSLAVLLPVIGANLTLASAEKKGEEEDSLYKQLAVFSEVLSLIRRAYVEETSVDELLVGAMDGVTDALDPLSSFIPADKVDKYLAYAGEGEDRSGLTLAKQRGVAVVLSVAEGSPAAGAGIEPGDVLAEIDGETTRQLPLWEIEGGLAAKAGTEVALKTLRRRQSNDHLLRLADLPSMRPRLEYQQDIPILRPGSIETDNLAAVRELLQTVKGQGYREMVLDLRGLAGGDPESAYTLAGYFADGELGMLRRREEILSQFAAEDEPAWKGELVVLINRASIGAAEILATVLRQSLEWPLVGEPTFGLAGRRTLVELSNGARLLITDAFYTGPDGESIRGGLDPDERVAVSVREDGDKDALPRDEILERALELLLEEKVEERKAA